MFFPPDDRALEIGVGVWTGSIWLRVKWWAVVNTVLKLRVLLKLGYFRTI
jgi:hypothetical protein